MRDQSEIMCFTLKCLLEQFSMVCVILLGLVLMLAGVRLVTVTC